jgi:hypothetical protein
MAPRDKNVVNLDDPRSRSLPTTCAGQDERASSPGLLLQTGEPPGVISAFNVTALPRPSWTGSVHVDRSIITGFSHSLHGTPRRAPPHGSHGPRCSHSRRPISAVPSCNVSVASGLESEHQTCRCSYGIRPHPYHMASWHESRSRPRDHPMQASWLALANVREVGITVLLRFLPLKMNADASANSLVGQLEIYRRPSPRWVPNAWARQALLDHAPSEASAAAT